MALIKRICDVREQELAREYTEFFGGHPRIPILLCNLNSRTRPTTYKQCLADFPHTHSYVERE